MNCKTYIKFDRVGYWSEIKLDIVKKYAVAYSKILAAQRRRFYHVYIDAFAGAGANISRKTGELITGSPLNALYIDPPFCSYHLIDIDGLKIRVLRNVVSEIAGTYNIHIYEGNCNSLLVNEIFPSIQWKDYRRGLCLLDPYGLHFDWKVIHTAGQMQSIDIFINFPVMDMNRNALWRNPDKVPKSGIERMNNFWGDESWRNVAYRTNGNLFGFPEKQDNVTIIEAYRERLKKVAGFNYVSKPLPMYNSRKSTIYYLLFASQKMVAYKIINDIYKKYQNFGLN